MQSAVRLVLLWQFHLSIEIVTIRQFNTTELHYTK